MQQLLLPDAGLPRYEALDERERRIQTAMDASTDLATTFAQQMTIPDRSDFNGFASFNDTVRWLLLTVLANGGNIAGVRNHVQHHLDRLSADVSTSRELLLQHMHNASGLFERFAAYQAEAKARTVPSTQSASAHSDYAPYDYHKAVLLDQLAGHDGPSKVDSLIADLIVLQELYAHDVEEVERQTINSGGPRRFIAAVVQAAHYLLGHRAPISTITSALWQVIQSAELDVREIVNRLAQLTELLRSGRSSARTCCLLVYFDTAQHADLDKAIHLAEHPDKHVAEEILRLLADRYITVAVSIVHLEERAADASDEAIANRAAVLNQYPSVDVFQYGMPELIWRECVVQILASTRDTAVGEAGPYGDLREELWLAYPKPRDFAMIIAGMRESAALAATRRDRRARLENSAPNFRRSAKGNQLFLQIGRPDDEHSDQELLAEMKEELLSMKEKLKDEPDSVPQWLKDLAAKSTSFTLSRQQMAELLHLDDWPALKLAPVSDYFSLAEITHDLLSRAIMPNNRESFPQLQNGRLFDFDPYLAPGSAHKLAADRALSFSRAERAAGDYLDVAHLAFTPYVDLLFADKRMKPMLESQAKKNNMPGQPNAVLVPERVVAGRTLTHVLTILRQYS